MVKKYKNLKKSQKVFFFPFFSFAEKKCYPLSFPILGGRALTRALQSSPFQKYKNLENF